MARQGMRRKRQDPTDQGVTFGQSALKDSVEVQKVSVQGIISQAHRLADTTERKIQKKKDSLESSFANESHRSGQLRLKAPQDNINAIANPDERAFVIAEKRKKYEIIVRDHPDKIRYWIEYADFEEKTIKSIDRCREIYDRAIAYHANNPEMIIHRGRLEERAGNAEEAVNIYKRIGIEKFPKESKFYYRIALLKERLGLVEDNPFDEWISRVCPPSIAGTPEDSTVDNTPIRQWKSPIEESVPHVAFEHAIEWTIRTHKANLRAELSASRLERNRGTSAQPDSVISQVRLACQKYVCTFNDSTSWGYYAKIESEVLKNPDRAELVYRVGIQSIPIEYLGKAPSKRHCLIMKLRLFKDFIDFLGATETYHKRKQCVRDIWNSQFTLSRVGTNSILPDGNSAKCPKLSAFLLEQQAFYTPDEDVNEELPDDDFTLATREEELYIEVCRVMCAAEETSMDMGDNDFTLAVQSDQVYMQYVRRIERLLRFISLLVVKDWVSDVNPPADVTSIQSAPLELLPALKGLIEVIENGFAEKDAIIDTVFAQVFRLCALVNGKLLRALRLRPRNFDSLMMRTICFLQEQRRIIALLCDILSTNIVDISKNVCIQYISLLEKVNELLLQKTLPKKGKDKNAPRGGRFHPTFLFLAKPIWIRLASMELHRSSGVTEGFRKLMGGMIGKSCAIGDFTGSFQHVWESFCNKQDFTSPILQDLPWHCPCRYPDPLMNLNGFFEFYLAQENDSDRIHMIMSSWQEKVGTLNHHASAILSKAHQHANLSVWDDTPVIARAAMREERRVLLSLYLYLCWKNSQWSAWVFDSLGGVKTHLEEKGVCLILDSIQSVSDVTQLLLPLRKGKPLKISEMLENIPSKTFNLDDRPTSKQEKNTLLLGVSALTDTLSTVLAVTADEHCTLCGKGVVVDCVEKRQAAHRKYAQRVHGDAQIENMNDRILNGDMLTPSTEEWSKMNTSMNDGDSESVKSFVEKCEKICIQRIERILSTVWSCAAVRRCLFDVGSDEDSGQRMPPEVCEFIRRQSESHRSHANASGEMPLYCTVPQIFGGNIRYLVSEIRVWLQAVLAKLRCTNFPLREGEMRTLTSTWREFSESILLCTQFVIFANGLFTASPLLAATSMRQILGETPEKPDEAEGEGRFMSLKEVHDRLSVRHVEITSDSGDKRADQMEDLIAYCIHPLRLSSEYLGKVQILVDAQFDEALNMYQEMLAEVTRAYVEILLSWSIEDINTWKMNLVDESVQTARAIHQKTTQNEGKKYKLFDIAKSRA
ncbi:pre-mRNA-splicing factor CLF1 [Perkinsela sp. CCAP 1560/4]|nr:pre-mRNA-splicing factor CLF1 [Perkinsela sp. CCAP 1560/4]|eukprot:KNH01798.1 pre-mRNA-splicing factor CLF1 [Perkinsela sp. CCAP 1560/4]